MAQIEGLNNRCDFEFGMNNIQLYLLFRRQMLGMPYGVDSYGMAASLEVGVSAVPLAGILLPTCDGHLGLNLSWGASRSTAYVSVRHHWGNRQQFSEADDEYMWQPFQQTVAVLGLEHHRSGGKGPLAIELVAGRPPSLMPDGNLDVWQTYGVNVIWGF
jgi:hypothetical protein